MKYLQSNITDFEFIENGIYYNIFYRLNNQFYYGVNGNLNRKLTRSIYNKLQLYIRSV